MRAIETGRAVVNVSTVGTIQVIGPGGTVRDGVGVDRAAAQVTTVPVRTGLTPASILGPWIGATLGWGSLLAVTALAVGHQRFRRPDTVPSKVAG